VPGARQEDEDQAGRVHRGRQAEADLAEVSSRSSMQAIILAAGVARRLAPLTDRTNKCLLPVGGRSLLDRMLEALAANGVEATTVVVGHDQDQVRAAAGSRRGGMVVRFVE